MQSITKEVDHHLQSDTGKRDTRFRSADPQRTEAIKQAVRDRLALPQAERPSIGALARQWGVTAPYIRQLTRRYEREMKVAAREKVPAEKLDEIRQKIFEGDMEVINRYREMAMKMLERAIKGGNIQAARLLLEHIIAPNREQRRAEDRDYHKNDPPIIGIALNWIPTSNDRNRPTVRISDSSGVQNSPIVIPEAEAEEVKP
jgi:hypothetical protein